MWLARPRVAAPTQKAPPPPSRARTDRSQQGQKSTHPLLPPAPHSSTESPFTLTRARAHAPPQPSKHTKQQQDKDNYGRGPLDGVVLAADDDERDAAAAKAASAAATAHLVARPQPAH